MKLPEEEEARIISIEGGRGFQSKLRIMGIRKGKKSRLFQNNRLMAQLL